MRASRRRLAVPDMSDWSRFTDKWQPMTVGKCFDKTVLDPSPIRTKHLQKGLLRLPIPKLEATCKRYKASVRPLLSEKDYAVTAGQIDDFEKGAGKQLQEALLAKDKANPGDSYISADWFDLYLKDRTPLPLNYNPSLITRADPDKKDGLTRAAFWIKASVEWYTTYLQQTLKPEIFYFAPKHYCRSPWFSQLTGLLPQSVAAKFMLFGSQFNAFPLDMSQYDSLMNSTRIPKPGRDELVKFGAGDFYVIVNYRGHQFQVTVAQDGVPVPVDQVYSRLKAIVDTNPRPPKVDVGNFTADGRDSWAAQRANLARRPTNDKSLKTVDAALFVVNLDLDTTADFSTLAGANKINMQFLAQAGNRWWDKSFSVNVTKDGTLGVNFEHAWGDGVAVLRYTVDTFNLSTAEKASTMATDSAPTEPVKQLSWELNADDAAHHDKVVAELEKEVKRCDYNISVFDEIGKKDAIFKTKVKPDPFVQVAMQLAWWRLNKSTVSTYESASTAAFKRGRTECIRSATMESQAFTVVFDNPKVSDDDKLKALVKAAQKHAEISKEAKMGEGVDRHLFALKKLSEQTGGKQPVFTDPAYATFGSNMISTSTLVSEALVGGGFGPVSPGYGVGYAVADNMMVFNVSSWNANGPKDSSAEFGKAVYAALQDMSGLIRKLNK